MTDNAGASLEHILEAHRGRVDDALAEQLPLQRPEQLYEASRYILQAGGKRLRPTVLLLVAEAVTGTAPLSADYRAFPDLQSEPIDILSAAVGIEVIQSFTLIHDDIMDDDDLRRGVPAVHSEYDVETAILAGDTLYSKAFEFVLASEAPPARGVRATEKLATTCTNICEGQAFDIEFESRDDVTVEEYLEMVELKTGVLYSAATTIPAILVGASDETVGALRRYGRSVGKAFQIQDDVLDLTTPSSELGKTRGSDLVESKQTLISVHARAQGVDVDALVDAEQLEAVDEATIDAAVEELEAAGSIEYARETAADLVESGKAELQALPAGDARRALASVADYLVDRSY